MAVRSGDRLRWRRQFTLVSQPRHQRAEAQHAADPDHVDRHLERHAAVDLLEHDLEDHGQDDAEADKIALIRSLIVMVYLITNVVIVAGVIRHWK